MRFITEFIVPERAYGRRDYVPEKRHLSELKMGNMLAELFGWQNPVNQNLEHHRLEIEAFPMDKWIEFRNKIIEESRKGRSNRTNNIIEMIKELESFGKPEGAAKEM